MREVDFRYLRAALESLNSSTDLVLANGRVKATLSRQLSPYASRRGVVYEQIEPIAEGALLAANYRYVVAISPSLHRVQEATERGPRPFDDALGWDGPRAWWVVERVPVTLLRSIIETARTYGLVGRDEWTEPSLLYTAWLVPVVVGWDEDGRPIFDWPERSAAPDPEPSDLPVEV